MREERQEGCYVCVQCLSLCKQNEVERARAREREREREGERLQACYLYEFSLCACCIVSLSVQRERVHTKNSDGVATISRLLKITGPFCKRAL